MLLFVCSQYGFVLLVTYVGYQYDFSLWTLACTVVPRMNDAYFLQGLMMGLISAAGSAGRTVGPLILANVYYADGPRATFVMCIGIISLALVILLVFYKRIVPYSIYRQKIAVKQKSSSINANSHDFDNVKSCTWWTHRKLATSIIITIICRH